MEISPKTTAFLPRALLRDQRLESSDKLVLLALTEWGYAKKECFAADTTIADAAGLSRRTCQLSLDRLVNLKLIRKVPDKSNPTGRKYLLLWLRDHTALPPLVRNPRYCATIAHELPPTGGGEKAAGPEDPSLRGDPPPAAKEKSSPVPAAVKARVEAIVRKLRSRGQEDIDETLCEVIMDAGSITRKFDEAREEAYLKVTEDALAEVLADLEREKVEHGRDHP